MTGDHGEVCALSGGVMLRSLNPYPGGYSPALAFSPILYPPPRGLLLRVAFPNANSLSLGGTAGLPRCVTVTVWVRSRLSAGGTTAALEEFGASRLDHVPFGPSVSASCRLAFVTTFNSASPELTVPHHSGSQPP